MSSIRCLFLNPTDRVQQTLRRYKSGSTCPVHGYHDAGTRIEDAPAERDEDGYLRNTTTEPEPTDPRWPESCACGYVFQDADTWQLFVELIYRRSDDGTETTLRSVPVGAMWYADWMPANTYRRNGPEHSLCVKTPGGDWLVDGPASNGSGWTRTGTPPDVTAMPSIGIGDPMRYHGWLKNGWLVDA